MRREVRTQTKPRPWATACAALSTRFIKHLLELDEIGVHRQRLRVEIEAQLDARGHRGAEQVGERARQLGEIDVAHLGERRPA